MSYVIEFSPTALKQLKKLTLTIQRQLAPEIDRLAINPRPIGYKKLALNNASYRVRVGDYRIIYSINDKIITIFVLKIGHRRDVYK